jgi:hypothetical protein
MFQGRLHKNYAAIQAAVLQAEAAAGQASALGTPNFWFDGSLYQYVIPTATASTSNYTTLNMLSKFVGGPGLAIKAFGIGSATSMSNPDFYISYNAFNSKTVSTFTAYIATGTAVQVQGTVSIASNVYASQSQAVLTLTSAPGTGITIGASIKGGTLPANTWVFSTVTNTSTYYLANSNGTVFTASATNATYTVTPVVMTVTTTTGGIFSQGNVIRHATAANVDGLTQITQVVTQAGGTGTFYLSNPQTKGTAGSPIAGYYAHMPSFNFNSNDGFRVAMTASNVLTGYTWIMAARIGTTSTGFTGILSTDHNFNNTTASGTTVIGEGINRNGKYFTYKAAGSTATGAVITTGVWQILTGVYDGTAGGAATRFQARVNGTATTLTFTGTPTTATLNPGTLTFTGTNVTALTATGAIATATVVSPNSQFFNVGQTITLGGWTISGTQGTINGTQTVTACTTNTVSFAITGTITTTTTKGYISGTPIVNLYVDGNQPAAYGSAIANANAATNGLELGELIWFNSALGTTAITAFETYMKNKWLGTN